MIEADEPVFPNNVVDLVATFLGTIDTDFMILKRPLRPTDPNQSIGLFGTLWMPDESSYEMGGVAPAEPTLSTYQLGVQCLVKDGDEERGLIVHSIMSKRVRSVLYRDQALRVSLGSLYVTDGLSTERTTRWGIRTQRYMNNDIEGKFVYLSTLDYWLETETT